MIEFLKTISANIKSEYVALFSVLVTIIIFVLNRQAELRYKKYEAKKVEYIKVVDMLAEMYSGLPKDKRTGSIVLTDAVKKQFFDMGASLLLYGSKRLYKKYIFFREYSTNPLITQSKFYDKNITIYLIAEMLVSIRKEVGLSTFNSISLNDSLAFFINSISNNPIEKRKVSAAKYKIRMMKLELFFVDRINFTLLTSLLNAVVRPIGGFLYLFTRYFLLIPLGRLLLKLFPSLRKNLEKHKKPSPK